MFGSHTVRKLLSSLTKAFSIHTSKVAMYVYVSFFLLSHGYFWMCIRTDQWSPLSTILLVRLHMCMAE